MKKSLKLFPVIVWITLLVNSGILCAQSHSEYASNRVLVRFKEGIHPTFSQNSEKIVSTGYAEIDHLNTLYSCTAISSLGPSKSKNGSFPVYQIDFNGASKISTMVEEYMKTGLFDYVEPDFKGSTQGLSAVDSLVPNDSQFVDQWSLQNDGTFWATPVKIDADIDMPQAWMVEQGDTNVIVGIIDTGCKLDHPELSGRIWINRDEIPGNGIDDDGNTYIDDDKGWDFAYSDNDPTDDYGHGTNVTGIIGCNGNNSVGFAGVDWNCKLMILKGINSDNWGYYSWWISAITYAVNNGAKVLNLSLGGSSASQALHDAIDYALENNVVVVASMMNENDDTEYIPASYPGVIAVGSTDPDDTRSQPFFWSTTSGSCFGPHISVVAPGNYIFGLYYNGDNVFSYYWGGTSQAAPHVAGLSSLLLAQNINRTPSQIRAIIIKTAEDQVGDPLEDTPGWDQYYGYGRINAFAALTYNPEGIEDNLIQTIHIYPNPASGVTTIEWDPVKFNTTSIRIYDLNGKLVRKIFLESQQTGKKRIETDGILPGIYHVCLLGPTGGNSQKLVIVPK